MSSFFTIDGDNVRISPNHPETVKYFDKPSADKMLRVFNEMGILKDCHVAEHNVSILTNQVTT
jgi:hypothetical protein